MYLNKFSFQDSKGKSSPLQSSDFCWIICGPGFEVKTFMLQLSWIWIHFLVGSIQPNSWIGPFKRRLVTIMESIFVSINIINGGINSLQGNLCSLTFFLQVLSEWYLSSAPLVVPVTFCDTTSDCVQKVVRCDTIILFLFILLGLHLTFEWFLTS